MNTTSALPGALLSIVILAAILTIPISFLLLSRYRKALIKGMGYVSRQFKTPAPEILPVQDNPRERGPEIKLIEAGSLVDDSSPVFFKLKETLGYHWFVYGFMCLAASLVSSYCYLEAMDAFSMWRLAYMCLTYFIPFLPISFLLMANGWKQILILSALLGFFIVGISYIIWAEAGSTLSYWETLKPIVYQSSIPMAIFFLLRLWWIRPVSLFLYSFFIFCCSGPLLFLFYVSSHPDVMERLAYFFIDAGMGAHGVLALWVLIPLLISIPVGWLFLKVIRRWYLRKFINDLQLNADAVMILFTICYALIISFSGTGYALLSLLAFPAYKLTGYLLFYFLRRRKIQSNSPRLLLLRVFALAGDSRNFFARILKHWRYAGSVQLISGPDLAIDTIEPHELMAFVAGELKASFCEDAPSIEKKIQHCDQAMDLDSTHRVNEFFCRDNNWKFVLKQLLTVSDVVLMDLRRFSRNHAGCRFEIEALVQHVDLDQVVFVVDERTDLEFTREVFHQAFAGVDAANQNIQAGRVVRLYQIRNQRDGDVFRILNQLCLRLKSHE